MNNVKAIVLRAAGINCDLETQHAFELAGAAADRVHINRIIEDKSLLDGYQILVVPGGFSYGDDVAAGKILANQIKHHLYEQVRKFIDAGKLVLGICNGFQVLVKAGILPGFSSSAVRDASREKEMDSRLRGNDSTQYAIRNTQDEITVTYNDSNKYEDRWVYLAPVTDRCVFIEKGRQIYLPVAHGEGKIVTKDQQTLEKLKAEGFIAFKYVDEKGSEGGYPVNPNGSFESIAGLTDSTGRVLGLMPHPERHVIFTQHPRWTRMTSHEPQVTSHEKDGDGITIFTNAVKYAKANL
ncbi:MAG: phosphoribosylformylglycinamidine synthase I [Sedimentisphaerales bacterium]|jgi:phosphoribosylformylglycinamidine synthase